MTQQQSTGSQNAMSGDGGTSTVNSTIIKHYHAAPATPAPPADVKAAMQQLAEMPIDTVPDPAGLPTPSRPPFHRNRLFVGREAEFRKLARALRDGGAAAVGQSPALSGWGGVGKTQLASEFAWRYGQYFQGGVFWLNFAEAEGIPTEIAVCGTAMALHDDFANLSPDQQAALVSSRWQDGLPRLLIFDNCEEPDFLKDWIPPGGDCRVLVTTRRANWPPHLGVTPVPLDVLSPAEATALLRSHIPALDPDDETLPAICKALGYLPLALELAGSYLALYGQEKWGAPTAYLTAIQKPDLLDHHSLTLDGETPTGRERSVAATFALSLDRLDPETPTDALARSILRHAAFFAPGEPIPRWLLQHCLKVAEAEAARRQFVDALRRLSDLGLIRTDQDSKTVSLHRLITAFAQSDSTEAEAAAVEEAASAAASEQNQTDLPAPLLKWQAHLRFVAHAAEAGGRKHAGQLFNALGYHLNMIADRYGRHDAFRRALKISEATYAPDHPEVAIRVNNLGGVLEAQGDLDGAKKAHQRALQIDEAAFGPDDPKVAIRVNNLGSVLQAEGDLDGAKKAFQRALKIDETTYGPDHPKVAIYVNNLGIVLLAEGDLDGAKEAYQRALRIDESAFGPDHPKVANRVNNLGGVLHAEGDIDGARDAYQRALTIFEKHLGDDHPNTQIVRRNLQSLDTA
jgi:tetratricopeptide (TPR) repeat protein